MSKENRGKGWERTNVTNLLRNGQNGIYYARVKVNGKQKWKSLKTAQVAIAKLRLADFEKQARAQGIAAAGDTAPANASDTTVSRFIAIYRERTQEDSALAPATKVRKENAIKALLKTWPDLPFRDARKVTPKDCQQWAVKARREGTGFVAPQAKTIRKGMAPASLNKCIEGLRGVFEIAREQGVAYANPADSVSRAKMKQRRLELPSVEQFHAIVKSVSEAGARQSKDCADMVQLLAYSGTRLAEATSLRWRHVDEKKNRITIPGTKTDSSYRVIPIFPPLASLLSNIHARRGGESAETSILNVHECKGALGSACAAVGIKRITHHDLRHLFATRCIENGVDVPTVSRWLGHSDGGALAMRTYGHLRQEHSATQAEKVSF